MTEKLLNTITLFKDNTFKLYNLTYLFNTYSIQNQLKIKYENDDLWIYYENIKLKLTPLEIITNTSLNENHSMTFIFKYNQGYVIQKPNTNNEILIKIENNLPCIQNNGDFHITKGNKKVSINTYYNKIEDILNNTYLNRLFKL